MARSRSELYKPGYDVNEAQHLTGASYRELDHWDRVGAVKSTAAAANGQGSRRRYSYGDLVA